jgi:4-amino-4-deoxy-L-arabinose transferase-like glycosyltransferase
MLRDRADRLALVFCLLFVALASLWISEVGIQSDEALFAAGIYPPFPDAPTLIGKPFPLMVMSYVGTLKSHLYRPILAVWPPSAASTRLPGVVLGGVTVWLFYVLLKRTLDVRTALFGAILLATDSTFALTTRWDWGPAVLQRLCLVAGMLGVVRFAESRRSGWLVAGFFVFGLGMWDKALFVWSLAGLGFAVLVVFPGRVKALLNARTLAVACASLAAGAAPLIWYNIQNDLVTLRQNTVWSTEDFQFKAGLLKATLEGSAMFGAIARDEWDGPLRPPEDPAKRALFRLADGTGAPRQNLQFYLLLLCLVLLPFVWKSAARTAFVFSLVYTAVTWAQMAFTQGAGTGAHHPALMWPLPQLGMAAVTAEASRRAGRFGLPIVAAGVGAVAISNVLVTATYYRNMLQNGGNAVWTDAIFPASSALAAMRPSTIRTLDWGFYDNLRLLHRGRIPLSYGYDPSQVPSMVRDQLSESDAVYITHTRDYLLEKESAERFLAFAESEGYEKTNPRIYYDYNGRPIIEVFRLSKR